MKALTRRNQEPSENNNANRSALQAATANLAPVLPFRLALIDSEGDIVAVNKDWVALAEETGASLNRVGPGTNYLDVCRRAGALSSDSLAAMRGINGVLKQRASSFRMGYQCHTPSGPAFFHMVATPIAYREARVCVTHTEVTGSELSRERNFKLMQQFALRLINAQEDERQRISQEMHDDLGSRIALMALSIRQISKQIPENATSSMRELNKIVEQITDLSAAVRDISHGLHPPLLRHVGIRSALQSLHETFEKTHGIRMNLTVTPELPRLSDEAALCIFRIAQESLQNVAKHSGAYRVTTILACVPGQIRLTVSDTGRGFVRSEAVHKGGLGLLSMEARALSVGGRLTVNSSPEAGTEIRLMIPLQERR